MALTYDLRDIQIDSAWRMQAFAFTLENDGAGQLVLTVGDKVIDKSTDARAYPEEAWLLLSNFFALCVAEAARGSRQAAG